MNDKDLTFISSMETPVAEDRLAEIALRRSPALMREFLTLGEDSVMKPIGWCARYGYRLEKLGLAKRTLLMDRSYLTPLGLAARAHLIERNGDVG